MVAPTEAELVQRILEGDEFAYRTVLSDQLAPVTRYVFRMTGNLTEAEDITQEVFLRLWTQADRFDPNKARLTTWLHNIAHNLCIDLFRKQSRFVPDEDIDEPASETSDPINTLMADVSGEDVKRALQQLPESQRSALVLCYYQGISNRDAAGVLEVTIPALESLLARGRRKLRRLLTESDQATGRIDEH